MKPQDLIGKKIVSVRYMTEDEMESMCWYRKSIVITLNDETQLCPSRDEEGNDAGCLFVDKDGESYCF